MIKKNSLFKSACIVWLIVGLPSDGYACRCLDPVSPAAAYQQADVVLWGKVLAVNGDINKDGGLTAKISVLKRWKQAVDTQVEVVTKTTCAYDLKIGEEYLLFLHKDKRAEYFTTEICKGNLPIANAKNTLEWLKHHAKTIENKVNINKHTID